MADSPQYAQARLDLARAQRNVQAAPRGTTQYNDAVSRLNAAKVAATPATASNLFQTNLVRQEQDFAQRRADSANTAQEATVRYWVETKGAGSSREPAFAFNVAFLEEPHLSYGFALAKPSAVADIFVDPVGKGTILGWLRNDRGHYTGVRMAYRVEMPYRNPYDEKATARRFDGNKDRPSDFTCVHHLAFTGLAYKAFSQTARTKIATTAPNQVTYATGGTATTAPSKNALQAQADLIHQRIEEFYRITGRNPNQRGYEPVVDSLREQLAEILDRLKVYYPQEALHFLSKRAYKY